jgi:hypothetical protein
VLLGKPLTLTATVSNTTNTGVSWSVEDIPGGNSTVGAITGAGTTATFTAPPSLPPAGNVTVEAASLADPSKIATAVIAITSDVVVNLSPASQAVALGAQQAFQAIVISAGNPTTAVTWKIAGVGCSGATCGTVSSAGVFTAPQALPSPTVLSLTATSVADPAKSATAAISITANITEINITVSPTAATVAPGSTMTFTGKVTGASDTSVSWDVNGIAGGNATLGTIASAAGNTSQAVYTAPAGVPSTDPVAVRARSDANPGATAVASVTIGGAPVTVQVSPSAAMVSVNHRQTFQAQVQNSTNTSVLWQVNGIAGGNALVGQVCVTSSNPCQPVTSAANGSVDYLAPQAVPSPNPVTLTAVSQADATRSASSAVTILPHVVVSVSPPSAILAPGTPQPFTATVAGTADRQVTWNVTGAACSGSSSGCGTIDATGLYVAPAVAPVPNVVSVVATSADDTSRTAAAAVTITNQPAVISLLPSSATAGATGLSLRVAGANFAASSPGPGSVIQIAGAPRSTLCASSADCSTTLSASDLAVAANLSVAVQNPGGASSPAVVFVVAPATQGAGNIVLTPASLTAAGQDIVVVDLSTNGSNSPSQAANLSITAMGIYQAASGTCSLNGGPVEIVRPASGTAAATICAFSLSGLDPAYAYTLSGPAPNDVAIVGASSLGFGIVELTIAIPSTAATGARTLFVENSNRDVAAASGAVVIE